MSDASAPLIVLVPSDVPDQTVAVPVEIATMSKTIADMLDEFGGTTDTRIPLHNVTRTSLLRVVAWCEHVRDTPTVTSGDEKSKSRVLTPWEVQFLALDQAALFELILTANYLDVATLLDATCQTVANMIKGKTPEEIRKTFNIKNDFTPEEEEKIRKENEWCEER